MSKNPVTRSQHKEETRECPVCHETKTFPVRSETCSRECADHKRVKSARPVETFDADQNSAVLTKTTETRVKTLAQLKSICEVDENVWEVERWVCNKWDMASVPRSTRSSGKDAKWTRPSTRPVVTELYQVKVWLRRKVAVIAARKEIASLIEEGKKSAKSFAPIKRADRASGYMLEISIPDLHVGKLSWGKETGWENYDTKIAEQVFEDALAALIQRTSAYKFEQVVFVVGNDLLHSDNKDSATTAGTRQDTDVRFQKSFGIARSLITRAIERLREIAPVVVPVVPGNHDSVLSWCLGHSLECYFHKCPDVTIDNEPTMRKYHQFGKVMLMLAHGNRGKLSAYPQVMAAERPEMFGATIHREAHTGDKHHFKVEEYYGVRVRISPALCPPDYWHAENFYVGASRSAEAFVWHRDEGLVGTAVYTVPSPKTANKE